MNETRTYFFAAGDAPKSGHRLPYRLIGVVVFAFLTGCRAEAQLASSPTPELETPVSEIHTIASLASVENVSLTLPDEEPADEQCIACHEDKQRLIDTAAAENTVEVESSGEG